MTERWVELKLGIMHVAIAQRPLDRHLFAHSHSFRHLRKSSSSNIDNMMYISAGESPNYEKAEDR